MVSINVCEMLATLEGPAYIERVSLHDVKHIKKAKQAVKKAFKVQIANKGFSLVGYYQLAQQTGG